MLLWGAGRGAPLWEPGPSTLRSLCAAQGVLGAHRGGDTASEGQPGGSRPQPLPHGIPPLPAAGALRVTRTGSLAAWRAARLQRC